MTDRLFRPAISKKVRQGAKRNSAWRPILGGSTFAILAWRFLRRAFAGAVFIYVFISCLAGEKSNARTIFSIAAGSWIFIQFVWTFVPRWPHGRSFTIPPFFKRSGEFCELVAFNLALTLFLAEYGLRFYASWSGQSLLVADTIDSYKLVPGHDYGGGLRGNNLGYPGKDFVIEKKPGVRRLAVLGDSFAVGPAVAFSDNFLTRLESLLPNVEAYNFGISSTGPREYQTVLHDDVWQFQPDIVLVCVFVGNDITENLPNPRRMSLQKHALYQFLHRASRILRENTRQPVLSIASSSAQFPRPALSEATFREVEARRLSVCQNPPPATMEKKWKQALVHLEHITVDCSRHQTPVGFVLIPDEFQVNPDVLATALQDADLKHHEVTLGLPQRRLREFCADHATPCLDLLPDFVQFPDTYGFRDTHWNVRGNHLAAEKIRHWLADWWK
jgi:hypothetical protein